MEACIHALYTLAAHPEYLAPLREEIERVTRAQGWSKASMTEMVKLDSFLKECMRLNSISARMLPPYPLVPVLVLTRELDYSFVNTPCHANLYIWRWDYSAERHNGCRSDDGGTQ